MKPRLLTVLGATLGPAVVWLVARAVGVDFVVDMRNGQPPMAVGIGIVLAFAAQAALLGWAALALLERFAPSRARLIWTVLALLVLLVSFAPFVTARGAPGTLISLATMHLVVAAVLVPLLPRRRA